ncbi:MAG: BCD family MFS transporter [Pseudomonadota bacterium]
MSRASHKGLSWFGIARLGLVQTALGAVVVLTTSTFNRVMVVELSLAAVLPGLLVAAHYAIQILRPRFGHGSDTGGRRTPWIIGGMIVLAFGGTLAAVAIAIAADHIAAGLALSLIAYLMIGMGVGACGTSLLVLLAERAAPERRPAAATMTWVMMIIGFIVTTIVVGELLDPFSMQRLVAVTAGVGMVAVLITLLASAGIESGGAAVQPASAEAPRGDFRTAIREVLSEQRTRRFGFFVFMSMLAYSAQDLLVEPFAGALFGLTPGESTQLGGVQHGGVLLGMILVGLIGSAYGKGRERPLRVCMVAGCLGSATMLSLLALAAYNGGDWPLVANLFALGLANGLFAVAAIGSMMSMVSEGHENRDGVRMGVWGAAQAIAFGLGGVIGTALVDVVQWLTGSTPTAYGLAFVLQAALFVAATLIAVSLSRDAATALSRPASVEPFNRVASQETAHGQV